MSDQQVLQAVDAEQVYHAWLHNRRHVVAHRHGMRWVRSGGGEYLVRLTDSSRNGRSLGARSPETEKIFAEFQAGKERADSRDRALREKLAEIARMNKALRLGRAPSIVGDILRALDVQAEGVFSVVGTHALFAYEAMAGVHMVRELLASGDVDLLADGRKKVSILADKLAPDGLIGLLRKVDKTFEPITPGSYRAANADGFMVDLLIAPLDMRDDTRVSAQAGDLVAAEVPGLQWLLNAPQVRATVIAADGFPFAMRVPDPRVFCLHKAWLSGRVDREPMKKGRDIAQAQVLAELIRERLPQYPFDETFLNSVSNALREAFAKVDVPAPGALTDEVPGLSM
ncbi:MAG: hypothetical protein HKL99_14065 [Burkholderiales bacterium]|nr:hypothetical protein [Burkholderiales bacterium]